MKKYERLTEQSSKPKKSNSLMKGRVSKMSASIVDRLGELESGGGRKSDSFETDGMNQLLYHKNQFSLKTKLNVNEKILKRISIMEICLISLDSQTDHHCRN